MTIQSNPLARLGYSIKEACEITSLSRSGMYNLIAAKRLHVVRIGGRTIVPAEALHALLEGGE